MKRRAVLLFVVFLVAFGEGYCQRATPQSQGAASQCSIRVDKYGRTVTDCVLYRPDGSVLERLYLGTEYFQDKIWQAGTVEVDSGGREIACDLSYNLSAQTLTGRFPGSPGDRPITPRKFTVGETRFVSYGEKAFGREHRRYFTVVRDGKVRLLKQVRAGMGGRPIPFELKTLYDGYIYQDEVYHIQHGDETPIEIQLTKRSVVRALDGRSDLFSARHNVSRLTVEEVIAAIRHYEMLGE